MKVVPPVRRIAQAESPTDMRVEAPALEVSPGAFPFLGKE